VSIFRVKLVACNPKQREQETTPLAALVDTGSELTWLPAEALRSIGIEAREKRTLRTTNGETVQREVGYAVLRANGSETMEEVVFGGPNDGALLGTRAMESFGLVMEDDTQFISLSSMVAFSARPFPSPRTRAG
jgi:predicted aspartyl protease